MTVRDGSQNVEFWVKITRFFQNKSEMEVIL